MYVLVRSDLPVVTQAVQACHAAHEAGAAFGAPPGCHLLLLSAASLHELTQALVVLGDLRPLPFLEPDLNHQVTAVAWFVPTTDAGLRRRFRRFPLWKGIP